MTRKRLFNHQCRFNHFSRFLLAGFVWIGCSALLLRGEAILDLTFDDPNGMIKLTPEGISKITPALSNKNATIASGIGGRAIPQIIESPVASEKESARPDEAKIQVLSEPKFGPGAFVRISLQEKTVTRGAGIGIIPDKVSSSLSSFVTYENGLARFDGCLDFFFRVIYEGTDSPKISLWACAGLLGFDLSTEPTVPGLVPRLYPKSGTLDTGEDGAKKKEGINGRSRRSVRIESGEIYHGAIVFRTTPEGAVTMDVCLQSGLGPMDVEESCIVTLGSFLLHADKGRNAADKITLNLGRNEIPQVLDIASVRIFSPATAVIPGIDGKK